jgi:hypothetical protein
MYNLSGRQRAKNRKKDKYLQQNLRHVHVHYIMEVKTRWAGIVVRMVYRRGAWRCFWWGGLRERDKLEDLSLDGNTILK